MMSDDAIQAEMGLRCLQCGVDRNLSRVWEKDGDRVVSRNFRCETCWTDSPLPAVLYKEDGR